MDLAYRVSNAKYCNIKDVLENEFKVSSRLYIKLRDNHHIYINRKTKFKK